MEIMPCCAAALTRGLILLTSIVMTAATSNGSSAVGPTTPTLPSSLCPASTEGVVNGRGVFRLQTGLLARQPPAHFQPRVIVSATGIRLVHSRHGCAPPSFRILATPTPVWTFYPPTSARFPFARTALGRIEWCLSGSLMERLIQSDSHLLSWWTGVFLYSTGINGRICFGWHWQTDKDGMYFH